MNDVLDIIRDGVRVNIVFDTESAIILGVTLFFAGVLALTVYAKVLQ